MTVRDNIGFGLKMARVPTPESKGRIDEALRLVGLEEHGDRLPGQLSGGQQQRVAVARALVNRPAVLLLDEPLGALDLKLRQRLQVELSQIHRDVGTTFVYVTHDQEEAMSMSTRIAVMSDGRIQQIGTPSEIYYKPRSRFVADFIGESNFLEVDASAAAGVARLADGRAVPCAGERLARRRRDADGAARVDPRRRPGARRRRLAARTHRADVVPRQPDARRGRRATPWRRPSPPRSSGASGSPTATCPATRRWRSGGSPTTQFCCQTDQRTERRSRVTHHRRTAQPGRPPEGRRSGCRSASPSRGPRVRTRRSRIGSTTLNLLTWSDHYANDQLSAVNKATALQGRPTLFSDNADAYLKIKQTGSQFDIVSGDALWVPKYHKDGLTTSFPLSELAVSKQLYSIARNFPFWKDGSNYMGYPFSWSTVQIYYNPKYVTTKPDSWHALLNSKYKGKISLENIPTDVMAIAGRATGREAAVRDDLGRDRARRRPS